MPDVDLPPLEVTREKLDILERFLASGGLGGLQGVELDSLRERHMARDVLVTLLKAVLLRDVVQVVPPDDHGSVHFVLDDDSGEDSAADGHVSGEGALLVDVVALVSLSGDLETKAWVPDKPGFGLLEASLLAQEDGALLLEASLVLISLDEMFSL